MATYTYTSRLNKGQLNFDDQKIIGALGQSADLAGADTIELVPDTDRYEYDQYLVIEPTISNHIHVRAGGTQDDSDAVLILGSELSSVTIDDQADGHVSILSRTEDDSTSHVWKFNNDGSTSFPALDIDLLEGGVTNVEALQFGNSALSSVITGPSTPIGDNVQPIIVQGQNGDGGMGGPIFIWAGDSNYSEAGSISIEAGDSSTVGVDPGSIQIIGGNNTIGYGGSVTIQGGVGNSSATCGPIYINSGQSAWAFYNNGITKFPYMNVNLHTGGPTDVEAIKFYDNSRKSVITGAVPFTATPAKPLIIQGQGQTGAAGGDVCLWGGDSTTAGGNIEILAGDNDGSSGTAGVVTIKGGDGATGFAGGNVAITGGTGTVHGEVTIASNSNTWTFNNDGNITVPAAKDILDPSNGSLSSGGNRYKSYNSASGVNVTYDAENIILITTTGGGALATTIRLPEIADIPIGYNFTVMDFSGGAATKNITVLPKGADEIISIGPAASGGIIIDTNYGLVTLKNVYAGWAILYGR